MVIANQRQFQPAVGTGMSTLDTKNRNEIKAFLFSLYVDFTLGLNIFYP